MKRQFFPNRAFWRLDFAIGLSHEFKPRANGLASLGLLSCSATAGATLQLLTRLARVQQLAACKLRVSRESLLLCTMLSNSSHSLHTLPLHESHLNTGLLSAKLQANWHGIKPTRWLINFNLTVANIFYG